MSSIPVSVNFIKYSRYIKKEKKKKKKQNATRQIQIKEHIEERSKFQSLASAFAKGSARFSDSAERAVLRKEPAYNRFNICSPH